RRHLRAARVLLRPGLPRDPARARRQAARSPARAAVRRHRLHPLCQDRAGDRRRHRGARAPRARRRSGGGIADAVPGVRRTTMSTMSRRAWLLGGTVALATVTLWPASHAAAQAYPQRPVRIIVPYPPGGSTDVFARLLAAQMEREFGQS